MEEDNDDMAWSEDWEDDGDVATARALETQQILPGGDPDEEELEDEIRANLSSKITSTLHAYKIAGVALIVTLITFTVNTVCHVLFCVPELLGICTICSRSTTLGETILYAVANFKRLV